MSYITSLDDHEVDVLREHLLGNFEDFSKFCFKIMTGTTLLHVDYYVVLFEAIQRLIDQTSVRMIINIPPRAGKTLLVSTFLPLFAWARNPSGQTILTGFNSDVLSECSGFIRSVMTDPDFERVFPDLRIDKNKKSVEKLGTMNAGVLHAIPTSGKMTGKGAGTLLPKFAGFMSIDDVIKPDDAMSPTERNKINNRFSNTLLSRLASETTPLVIIMQRLHQDDLCGYLMKGNTSDNYDWLNIPGIITEKGYTGFDGKPTIRSGSKEWYQKQIDAFGYTNVNPILYDLKRPAEDFDKLGESSFWSIRKKVTTLQGLREKDPYTYNSQYAGMPASKGKTELDDDDIATYVEYSKRDVQYTFITADTASTTENYSDYTVACHWAFMRNKDLLLIDVVREKFKVPALIRAMREFWKSKNVFDLNAPSMKPVGFYMEDKASGIFLNQQYLEDGTVRVKPVPRDGTKGNDKFSRFLNAVPYITSNQIKLPKNHPLFKTLKLELLGQTELGNNTGHDDFCDNVSDAVSIAYAGALNSYENWA